jgi:hypothetical protein
MYELFETSVGADYDLSRNNRGMVNGRGTPVGPDSSRPPPIYRPVGNPPHTQINVSRQGSMVKNNP